MKLLHLILFALLLSSIVSANEINAPKEVSTQANWNFSIKLDQTDSFEETKVFLDGKHIVSAYSNAVVQLNPFNGSFVEKAFLVDQDPSSNGGLTLYVSYLGLAEGRHKLKSVSLKDEKELNFVEKEIIAFKPINSTFENETQNKLDNLSESVNKTKDELGTRVDSTSKKISGVESLLKDVELKTSEIEKEAKKVSSIQNQLNYLTSELSNVKKENENLKKEVNSLKENNQNPVEKVISAVNKVINPGSQTPPTAQVTSESFPVNGLFIPVLALIVVVVLLFAIINQERINDFSKNLFQKKSNDLYGEDLYTNEKSEEEVPVKKGKWAADKEPVFSDATKEKERKKFFFSALIKKDKK